MIKPITKLCNDILDNDGFNDHSIDCSEVFCEECPFENLFGSCQELTSNENIERANKYLMERANKYLMEINKTIPSDNVNNPRHYNTGTIEVITVIEDWKLNFNLGNAIKYIGRCEHKNNKKEDIKKAIWYLERELKNIE